MAVLYTLGDHLVSTANLRLLLAAQSLELISTALTLKIDCCFARDVQLSLPTFANQLPAATGAGKDDPRLAFLHKPRFSAHSAFDFPVGMTRVRIF